jgi:uncharacterized protein (DUF1499 family)
MGIFRYLIAVIIVLPIVLFIVGQLGMLRGKAPASLGLADGKLRDAHPKTENTVSSTSQVPYAAIAPLAVQSAAVKWPQLIAYLNTVPSAKIVSQTENYIHAEFQTRWLKFVDDVEFYRDDKANQIEVRSASRLGKKDFGVNRNRVEWIRQQLKA